MIDEMNDEMIDEVTKKYYTKPNELNIIVEKYYNDYIQLYEKWMLNKSVSKKEANNFLKTYKPFFIYYNINVENVNSNNDLEQLMIVANLLKLKLFNSLI
jgi:hypothetical protein